MKNNKNYMYQYDVCIIGSGAVGLYIANKLCNENLKVSIVDIGGDNLSKKIYYDRESIFVSDKYHGALEGRNFGLGGSTQSWGGVLIPYSKYDCKKTDKNYNTWCFIDEIVKENSNEVLSKLKINNQNNFFLKKLTSLDNNTFNNNFVYGYSKTLPPNKRNFGTLFFNKKIDFFKNSFVNEWFINDNALHSVQLKSCISNNLKIIKSKIFIVCAGAIESTRILLEINQSEKNKVFNENSDLGYYLGDHISCKLLDLEYSQTIINEFSPKFYKDIISTVRMINKDQDDKLPRFFIHIIFDIKDQTFQILKNIYKNIQMRNYYKAIDFRIFKHSLILYKYIYYRYFKKKLYIPKNTKIKLQIDFEQEPSKDNYIKLSEDIDSNGRNKSMINWKITKRDRENLKNIIGFINSSFKKDSLLTNIDIPNNFNSYNFYDSYHPVGTCSMGADEKNVVNNDLKVRNISNLYSLSSAIFPSAGSSNPTFSLLCFANNLSNNLIKIFK